MGRQKMLTTGGGWPALDPQDRLWGAYPFGFGLCAHSASRMTLRGKGGVFLLSLPWEIGGNRGNRGRKSGTDGTFSDICLTTRLAHNDWRFSEKGNFPSVPRFLAFRFEPPCDNPRMVGSETELLPGDGREPDVNGIRGRFRYGFAG